MAKDGRWVKINLRRSKIRLWCNRNDAIYRARLPITNLRNPQWYRIPGSLKMINARTKVKII